MDTKKELRELEKKILLKIKELIKEENLINPKYIPILTQKETLEKTKVYKSTYSKEVEIKGKKYKYKPMQLHITIEGFENTITIAHAQSKKRKASLNRLYRLLKAYKTVRSTIEGLKEVDKIKKMLEQI